MLFSGRFQGEGNGISRKMTFEERIAHIWKNTERLDIDCISLALLLALEQIREEKGGEGRCEIPNERLEAMLHIDVRRLRAARGRLIDLCLIGYEAGNAKRQPVYIFEGIEKKSLPKSRPKSRPKEKPKPKPVEMKEAVLPFKEEKKVEVKPKKVKIEAPHPTLEEVERLFMERGETREEAEMFYYYYDAQGWVTSAGQKIKRLDSMVNRWLTNDKRKIEKQYEKSRKYGNSDEARGRRIEGFREYIARKLAST